ncbi:MAG: response regulator, partial [Desulfuromonadales bacterium]|nr:response regulator [Desulfuromonadales bacterium]
NMLGGIIGSAELLKRRTPEDERSQKFLRVILESAERAAELTGKLLAFARKQHVSSTPVDAHLALRNALSLLESTVDRRIRIQTQLEAASNMVIGDLSQLQNAFLNLCINASHAMPDGGDLMVSSKIIELDKIYCDVSSFNLTPGLFLEIEFRDNGCGIPTEQLDKIFDPFFTTKEQGKGTGLGLPAVLGTIQSHKGEVTVYSEIDTGTVFHVLLPLTEHLAEKVEPVVLPQRGVGLVLVVDDEAVMRATAGAILEDLGYQVLLAENGRVGLEVFKEKRQEIDLVLLDMIMPEMNGRDCFHHIRQIDPTAKVVLSSGFTQSDDLADLRTLGLSGFIPKPFRGSALGQIIAEVLAED